MIPLFFYLSFRYFILKYDSESWIITKQFGKIINSFATTAHRFNAEHQKKRKSLHLQNDWSNATGCTDSITSTTINRSQPSKNVKRSHHSIRPLHTEGKPRSSKARSPQNKICRVHNQVKFEIRNISFYQSILQKARIFVFSFILSF